MRHSRSRFIPSPTGSKEHNGQDGINKLPSLWEKYFYIRSKISILNQYINISSSITTSNIGRAQEQVRRTAMTNSSNELKIVIIAGPNGAGKTTFAREFLPNEANCPVFINADLIAAGLSPFSPESVAIRAGRLMLEEIEDRVRNRRSFAFETTLSGRAYLHKIRQWRELGYNVKLLFLSLPNADVAVARVAARVAQGGHNVPEEIIRRRFNAGLKNFDTLYKPQVDAWMLYDNSESKPKILAWGEK
jgi:predicted ABC-type ATPase